MKCKTCERERAIRWWCSPCYQRGLRSGEITTRGRHHSIFRKGADRGPGRPRKRNQSLLLFLVSVLLSARYCGSKEESIVLDRKVKKVITEIVEELSGEMVGD